MTYNLADRDDFERVRHDAEEFYGSVGEVKCPYFREAIPFNARGWRHILFKSDQQARSHEEQYSRLKLIRLAPEVLRESCTVQGIWETKKIEVMNVNSRWDRLLKHTTYWEFIAVLKGVRVKVIVKQVEGGRKHFWSIIPFWGIDKVANRRILHSGDPEYD